MKLDVNVIAALTGLVGAVGGILISYLTLKHTYAKDKHRVKVELGKNLMVNVPGVDSKKEQFTIMVANIGSVPFTVANVGINLGRYSGGLAIPQPLGTHQLPVILERDQTCNFWLDYGSATKSMQKLTSRKNIRVRARISDYTGRNFYSKWREEQFKETSYSRFKLSIITTFRKVRKVFIP